MTPIEQWLSEHPLDPDKSLDSWELPEEIIRSEVSEDRLLQADRFLRTLSREDQELLVYSCKGLDPALILESLPGLSAGEYWDRRNHLCDLLGPVTPDSIVEIHQIREQLAVRVIETGEAMERAKEAERNRRRTRWFLGLSPVFLAAVLFGILPVLLKPSPSELFNRYRSLLPADTLQPDTVSYDGLRWYEAQVSYYSGNPSDAVPLLEELLTEGTDRINAARWMLAMSYLQAGDRSRCREQLKLIRESDPDFFSRYGRDVIRKL